MPAHRMPSPQALDACWWSDDDCSRVAGSFRAIWSGWLAEWVPERAVHDAAHGFVAGRDSAKRPWRLVAAHGDGRIWASTSCVEEFSARAIFSCPLAALGSGSVARRVCREASDHWSEVLAAAFAPPPADQKSIDHLFRPWSGAVVVTLGSADDRAIEFLMDAAAVRSLIGRHLPAPHTVGTKLTPLPEALEGVPVRAHAVVAECELEVGELCELRPGDVIPLSTALDAPLRLMAGDQFLFNGYLGRRGRDRAIEVAP